MSDLVNEIKRKLGRKRVFYVCRDVERAAAGLLLGLPNFYIITNDSPHAKELKKKYKNVVTVKNKEQLDTYELLTRATTIKKGDLMMVFKPTAQIEKICTERGWQLLNPSAELANRVEEKISQVEWLGPLKKYLPKYKIQKIKNIKFVGTPFIVQFAHAHTGSGTILIKSKKQLDELNRKFPDRPARVAKYIPGPLFTNNNVVWDNKVLIGNINYQITGLKPFTNRAFATIGNDWELPRKILTTAQIKQYKKIATDVGKKLARDGWKGLFGIDVVMDEKTKRLFLVEINARQPASTTYESELQYKKTREQKNMKATATFTAHLAALLNITPKNYQLTPLTAGAQIIQRLTNSKFLKIKSKLIDRNTKSLIQHGFKTIVYPRPAPEADWIRFLAPWGLMSKHNQFNDQGRRLVNFIAVTVANKLWDRPRASVLIIKDKKILLLKRHKFGQNYFIVPGGTVEPRENIRHAAIRETKEETGLKFNIDNNQPPIVLSEERRQEHYFFPKNISGQPKLGGPEAKSNTPDNSYELVWVEIKKLNSLDLVPEGIAKILIKKFA